MISERLLRKWRIDALSQKRYINTKAVDPKQVVEELACQDRILKMTQELLDQHLLRKE